MMLMPPNQPAQPEEPQRYDFFLNPPPAPKKSKLPSVPGVKDPFLKKVIMLIGGGILLIIVVIVLSSVLLGNKDNVTSLIKLAQEQNELIRVAGEATSGAVQQTTKSLAVSTQLSLTTSQQQLVNYLKTRGHKVSTKQLALTQSKATDTQLTNATAASNFDPVFTQILQQQLQTYTQDIKHDFNGTSNTTLRQLLNTEYMGGTVLLAQATSTLTAVQAQ